MKKNLNKATEKISNRTKAYTVMHQLIDESFGINCTVVIESVVKIYTTSGTTQHFMLKAKK